MSAERAMIVLVTDYGLEGPYLGQVQAVFHRSAPNVPVVNLFADAPAHNPRATAYLIGAYAAAFPEGTVFLCVVDPGVGSWQHKPVIVYTGRRWFVGPDNGLFNVITQRHAEGLVWPITWRPEQLSASFHGRDIYAPTAARLAIDQLHLGPAEAFAPDLTDWPLDLAEIVYIDRYGNAMTGLRAEAVPADAVLEAHGQLLCNAECFSKVSPHQGCWYRNSNGLVELAVNCGRAADVLNVAIGTPVKILPRKH